MTHNKLKDLQVQVTDWYKNGHDEFYEVRDNYHPYPNDLPAKINLSFKGLSGTLILDPEGEPLMYIETHSNSRLISPETYITCYSLQEKIVKDYAEVERKQYCAQKDSLLLTLFGENLTPDTFDHYLEAVILLTTCKIIEQYYQDNNSDVKDRKKKVIGVAASERPTHIPK